MVRGLMSDEEWAFFAPFVIETGPRRGRRPRDHRLVLDGVFWLARTGSAWRDLHDHFGKWSSVYRQFRRWAPAACWCARTMVESIICKLGWPSPLSLRASSSTNGAPRA